MTTEAKARSFAAASPFFVRPYGSLQQHRLRMETKSRAASSGPGHSGGKGTREQTCHMVVNGPVAESSERDRPLWDRRLGGSGCGTAAKLRMSRVPRRSDHI